jgi:tripartite-type tricarboxylate transporter receptor subunit TctC
MFPKIRTYLLPVILLLFVVGIVACAGAAPQPKVVDYPTKDITFVVPTNPGGTADTVSRLIAPYIAKYLPKKVNVNIKNVPGASNKVGYAEVAKSAPDGYTIGSFEPFQFAVHRVCGETEIVDIKTVTPLGRSVKVPYLLGLAKKGPFKSVADMKGQRVTMAVGTEIFVAATVANKLGVKEFVPVVYDGGSEIALAVARGDTDTAFLTFSTLFKSAGYKEGLVSGALVTLPDRHPSAPDIKTAKELGLDLAEGLSYTNQIILGPAGIPSEVAKILSDAIFKAAGDPDYSAALTKAEYMNTPMTVAEVSTLIAEMSAQGEKGKDLYCPLRIQ